MATWIKANRKRLYQEDFYLWARRQTEFLRARPDADPAPELEQELDELYARARKRAAGSLRDHGEPAVADVLPAICPYSLERITGDWLP